MEESGEIGSAIERARLALLVDNLNQAILMETPQRRVARTNQAFCSMFQIPAPPEALVGGDCVEAARSLGPLFGDIDAFLARVDDLIADWRTVTDERITLTDGRLLERDFLPVTHTDGSREIAWVYRDVTEWEVLRASAESAAQQNADLLSAISHDVRTPVTGIVGLVELLQSQPIDERTRQIVEGVRQSAASLTTMLDDFLDAARADAGLLEVNPERVAAATLVESVTDMVAPLARAKGLLLITGIAPEVPTEVVVDPGRVRQVLLNVVSNAVKFTAEGVVALTISVAEDHLVLTCQDTGPGLGRQRPDDLFGAYVRGADATTHAASGAGLGLAIASKLAAVMGGSLRVAQTGPKGSTFVLSLPLVAADAAEMPTGRLAGQRMAVVGHDLAVSAVAQSLTRAGAEIVVTDPDVTVVVGPAEGADTGPGRKVVLMAVEPFDLPPDAPEVVSVPTSEAALIDAVLGVEPVAQEQLGLPPLPDGRRVLIVEDDATNRTLIAQLLEVLGVQPVAVAEGTDALHALAQESFDAVLMDIHLPGLDGVATTRAIRERRREGPEARLPIVAMSGSSGWTDPQQMVAAGFDATLEKPMTLAQLHACLAAVLPDDGGPQETAAALDIALLDTLARDLGDRELVRETVRTYLSELPGRLQAMTEALRYGDHGRLKETAHSLKSASAMLGATGMAQLCAGIERAAAVQEVTPDALRPVMAESERVAVAMDEYAG